jgi:2-polyprenyl-3-methyl-5-hydroxy-6-metoxy-1,4-benzoquinol methylase
MTYSLNANGIFTPDIPVVHREEEYDSRGFDVLRDMQSRHFWYQGRHRFLLRALKEQLGRVPRLEDGLKAIDLGGGCGGWLSYLQQRLPRAFTELAVSDSSLRALELAGPVVGGSVARYQTDLLRLGWQSRWDVAFLLDVLEHIPDDAEVLLQIKQALKPGGLLFVTTPALQCFWSYNDAMAHHVRRYSKSNFERLAGTTGLLLRQARYFMFFLSPLLWLSRVKRPELAKMSNSEIYEFAQRSHRVPPAPINGLLRLIFSLETPWGLWLPFPWGTSILGVFQKPS